jgi:hypothetical protein
MHDEFNNFLDVGCKWHPRKTKQPAMPSPSSSSGQGSSCLIQLSFYMVTNKTNNAIYQIKNPQPKNSHFYSP